MTKEFEVKKYGILTDTYRSEVKESAQKEQNGNFPKEVSLSKYEARTPSDHFPVMIVVEVKTEVLEKLVIINPVIFIKFV